MRRVILGLLLLLPAAGAAAAERVGVWRITGGAPKGRLTLIQTTVEEAIAARGLEVATTRPTPPEVKKVERKCKRPTPTCAAAVGEALGVKRIVVGAVKKQKGTLELQLTLVDVASITVIETVTGEVGARSAQVDVRAIVDKLAAALAPTVGTLVVEVNVPAAAIELDGKLVGPSPIKDVTPGSHQLRVSAVGHQPHQQTIEVTKGGELRLAVVLDPDVQPAPEPPAAPEEPPPAVGAAPTGSVMALSDPPLAPIAPKEPEQAQAAATEPSRREITEVIEAQPLAEQPPPSGIAPAPTAAPAPQPRASVAVSAGILGGGGSLGPVAALALGWRPLDGLGPLDPLRVVAGFEYYTIERDSPAADELHGVYTRTSRLSVVPLLVGAEYEIPLGALDVFAGAAGGLWRMSGTHVHHNAYGSFAEDDSAGWRLGYRFAAGGRLQAGPGRLQIEVGMRRSALRSSSSETGHTVVPVPGVSLAIGYWHGF